MARWISLDLAERRPQIPAQFGRDVNQGMPISAFLSRRIFLVAFAIGFANVIGCLVQS